MLKNEIREEIFKVVFREPFMSDEEMEEQISYALEELENKSEENRAYINDKIHEILSRVKELDKVIGDNCEGWNIKRIGKAELTIMRIAVYEMLFEDGLDTSISINEAVELSKKYCDDEAKGFVNAVLGKIARSGE